MLMAVIICVGMVACSTPTKTSSEPEEAPAEPAADTASDTADEIQEVADVEKEGMKIGFCFVDLETPFWVAGYNAITDTLKAKGIEVVEYNASEDPIKQFQMCNDAIAEGIDGLIVIPQDGDTAVAIGQACNDAGVPVGIFNRPPTNKDAKYLVAVADNEAISQKAMEYMAEEAAKVVDATGKKILPLVMVGDLGDPNAIFRKQGFDNVIAANPDIFETPIEVQTNWDAKVAFDNLTSAMMANPDVGLIFCGSDFLYPQIQQVLEGIDKWAKIGEPNHVILGAVDGDSTAGRLMDEGYVDATAVQDLYYEAELIMNSMIEAINAGETTPDKWIDDPGFALTQGNMDEMRMKMWGNIIRQKEGEI